MLRLEDLIGKNVTLEILNSEHGAYEVTLHGVEVGGLWVENPQLEALLGHIGRQPGWYRYTQTRPEKKPVFFIPYAQIAFLVASSTELDEGSLSG
jgi:hypothetical protein